MLLARLRSAYRSRRSRFLFATVGLPVLAFMLIISIAYIVFFSVMFFVAAGFITVAMLPRAIKTRQGYLLGVKVALFMLVAFTALVPNPLIWGQQVARRLDHASLITPGDPAVQALNGTGSDGLWTYMQDRYGASPATFASWSLPVQVQRVYYYIRSIITYRYDIDNNQVFDHVATPREVLESRRDDCQGISCLLASLLVFLGYNAFVCEVPFHWYVRVFYVNETDGTPVHVDLYRTSRHPEPFYMFNETTIIFHQDFLSTIHASWSFDYIHRKFLEIVNGTNGTIDLSVISSGLPETSIPAWAGWVLVAGACLLAGWVMSWFARAPRFTRATRAQKWFSSGTFGACLFAGCIAVLVVPPSAFLYLGLALVGTGTFLCGVDVPLLARNGVRSPRP